MRRGNFVNPSEDMKEFLIEFVTFKYWEAALKKYCLKK